MVEPLDADMLKDLRGLGKPPVFDGHVAEYQDFRFSFRTQMSLVSSVTQTLMDKCEAERNQITLEAVKSLGEARRKCCICRCIARWLGSRKEVCEPFSVPLNKACRPLHSRYAPDTRCDHTEGFESGLRAWELDVGEWERVSGTAMLNMAPIFLGNNLQLVTDVHSAAFRIIAMMLFSRKFGASQTLAAGNRTGADDDSRTQVDSLKKGMEKVKLKGKHPKLERFSHKQHKQHRRQHLQELWWNWTLGERLLKTRWRGIRQLQQHKQRQKQRERQGQRQTAERGTNESVFRNCFDSVVSVTDTGHD